MEQYISKAALVAEIKARISDIEVSQKAGLIKKRDADMKITLFKSILSFTDTLEVKEYSKGYDGFLGKELKMVDDEIARLEKLKVKEVDLEKEITLMEEKYHGFESLSRADVIEIIKHFFELGLKIAQKRE